MTHKIDNTHIIVFPKDHSLKALPLPPKLVTVTRPSTPIPFSELRMGGLTPYVFFIFDELSKHTDTVYFAHMAFADRPNSYACNSVPRYTKIPFSYERDTIITITDI